MSASTHLPLVVLPLRVSQGLQVSSIEALQVMSSIEHECVNAMVPW